MLATLIAFGVLVTIIAGVWTDWLWYRSVQYGSVFDVTYGHQGGPCSSWPGSSWWPWSASTPGSPTGCGVCRPAATERPGVEAYRMVVDLHRRLLLGILLGLIGLISGITASGAWRTWLLFINQVPFGRKDAQFGLDISFFVFTYPFLRLVLSYLFAAVFLSLLVAAAVHVLYGGLGWHARRPRATMGAQAHLFVLVGVFVLLKGAAYWVDRWGLDFSQRGAVTTGASYTDVNAVLPAKTVLAVIAVLCAVLFFAGAVRRSALLPAVGFGLLVLSAILIGGSTTAIIQQFVVKPNELAKETLYINREITATRVAYAVHGVRLRPYSGTHHPVVSGAARAIGQPARVPADGPGRGVPRLPATPAGQGVLPVPGHAGGVTGICCLAKDWCRRTWSWPPAGCPGRRPARATGSTPTWCTRTVTGSSPPGRTP